MSDELKPCPFCGSNDVTPEYDAIVWYVSCDCCCTLGPQELSRDEAIVAWNEGSNDD